MRPRARARLRAVAASLRHLTGSRVPTPVPCCFALTPRPGAFVRRADSLLRSAREPLGLRARYWGSCWADFHADAGGQPSRGYLPATSPNAVFPGSFVLGAQGLSRVRGFPQPCAPVASVACHSRSLSGADQASTDDRQADRAARAGWSAARLPAGGVDDEIDRLVGDAPDPGGSGDGAERLAADRAQIKRTRSSGSAIWPTGAGPCDAVIAAHISVVAARTDNRGSRGASPKKTCIEPNHWTILDHPKISNDSPGQAHLNSADD